MKISSKQIARSGLVAALYIILTIPFGGLSTQGFFQIRPGEGLCLLVLIFPEAVVGLSIGCFVVNILTSTIIDAILGTIVTIAACLLSRLIKKPFLAAIPHVVLNAIFVPVIYLLMGGYEIAYWYMFFQILVSEIIWAYGLGIGVYYTVNKINSTK